MGAIHFQGLETLNGDGIFFQAFAGLRYALAKRVSLTTELGPALLNLSGGGQSVSSTDWIVTTGVYFHLF